MVWLGNTCRFGICYEGGAKWVRDSVVGNKMDGVLMPFSRLYVEYVGKWSGDVSVGGNYVDGGVVDECV